MKSRFLRTLICAVIAAAPGLTLLAPSNALAWPPTYGLELNLQSPQLEAVWSDRIKKHGNTTRGQMPSEEGEHAIAKKFAALLEERCRPDCEVRSQYGKFSLKEWRFRFKDGFEFNVSVDPATIELQIGPLSLEDWRRHETSIQKFLFDIPSQMGLSYGYSQKVRGQENSAHLNIGARSAFEDGKAFARYLADYWQYPELGSGLLGHDSYNAPTLWELTLEQREAAKRILESANQPHTLQPHDIAREIERQVYTQSPGHTDGAFHYQSVGMKYLNRPHSLTGPNAGDQPIELRANRNPTDAKTAILQLELQEKRLEWLKTRKNEPIQFSLDAIDRSPLRGSNSQDLVTAFYLYLDDMGLAGDYVRFKKLLPRNLQSIRPHDFVLKPVKWRNIAQTRNLEEWSSRARHSPALLRILKKAFEDPGSESSLQAQAIRNNLGPLLEKPVPAPSVLSCPQLFSKIR